MYAGSESELRIFDFGHWRALARNYARKLNIAETTHVIHHLTRNFTLNKNSLLFCMKNLLEEYLSRF